MIIRNARCASFLLICGLWLLPAMAWAQSSDGTLVGTVTDSSGAAVPNAKVRAISPQYGAMHEAVTDDVGTYRIDALQPGTYSVTFDAPGFSELQVGSVILSGSVTTTVNGELKVGAVNKTIIVEATAAQVIDEQSGQLGESIDTKEVENLPYTSFNPAELAMTLPGVQDTQTNNSFSNGINYSVNGTRPRANNFLIDGQDNNDWSIGGQAYQPDNLGAIQEFTVLTNSYSAEYGRGGGSVGNYIYKAGTNSFHAQAWEVNQDSAFQAIPAQNKFLGDTTNPLFIENTFGFDVGGPVVKDKLFFFGTMQWNPTAQRATGSQLTLPTALGVTQLQALLPNANVQLLLNALGGLSAPQNSDGTGKVTGLPGNAPNCIALGPGSSGTDRGCVQAGLFERTGVKEEGTDNNWNVRLDYHVGPNDVLFGSYIRSSQTLLPDFFNNAGALPQFDSAQNGTTNVFRGGWTHTFSSSMVNELRFSYTSIGFIFDFPPSSLNGPLAGIPQISFGSDSFNNLSFGLASGTPQGRSHHIVQAQDAVTFTHGRHTIKGGVDVTFLAVTDQVPFNNRGSIGYALGGQYTLNGTSNTFTSLANYVDDFGGASPSAISKQFGNPVITPNATIYAPYVEDTWRVKENLTLTAGLRYEYWGTVGNSLQFPAIDSRLTFGVTNSVFPNSFGFQQKPDTNNFGPRLGFAYTPHWGQRFFGHNATVIRGGYGIFYDGLFTNIVDNTNSASPNANGLTILGGGSASRGQPNAMATLAGFTNTASSLNLIETMKSNLKNPLTQQWNLDIQRELPGKLIVTAAYVGTRGQRLFVNQDFNPGIGFDANFNAIRQNQNYGEIEVRTNGANSWYHAAQLEVERRFHTDLTLRGSYTFSKFLDDGSEVFPTTTSALTSFSQILTCQICDWGPSTYDRRHRLVLSYIWAMPYSKSNWVVKALTDRWQWSGIATIDSGNPDTPFDGFDNIGNGHPNSRPNLSNPKQPLSATGIDGSQLGLSAPGTFFPLSTCFFGNPGTCAPQPLSSFHFVIPALGPGNAGRNSVYGPGQWYFDTSVSRRFPIPMGRLENQAIEFRTEFFNAFNHPNLFTPSYDLISNQYNNTAATVTGGRTIKFWLKYEF
jgi:outer membrane receptor protein involved in Fe transport